MFLDERAPFGLIGHEDDFLVVECFNLLFLCISRFLDSGQRPGKCFLNPEFFFAFQFSTKAVLMSLFYCIVFSVHCVVFKLKSIALKF